MDELEMLKNVLATPAPPSEAVRKGRRELQQLIRRQARGRARRPGWRLAGIGLTATAAAGAVMVTVVVASGAGHTGPSAPGRPTAVGHHPRAATAGHHPPAGKLPVRQILLTAATSAARAPAGSGTYWYVRTRAAIGPGNKLYLSESWTKRDGETWIRSLKPGSTPIKLPANINGPFFLGGQELTFRQIQALPTRPAALTKWIVANAAQHGGKTGGPAPSKAREREDIFDSLTSLLSQLPSPPKLRAAAFRALASLHGVTSLGPLHGGQGLRFTLLGGQTATLIIDPSTGQIRGTNFFVDNEGAEIWQQAPTATITGRWTDTLPK